MVFVAFWVYSAIGSHECPKLDIARIDFTPKQRSEKERFNISHQSSVISHQLNFSVVLRVPYKCEKLDVSVVVAHPLQKP